MTDHDSAMIYADYTRGEVTQITINLPAGASREDIAAMVGLFLPAPAATVRSDPAETKVMTWQGSEPINTAYSTGQWDIPDRQYQ